MKHNSKQRIRTSIRVLQVSMLTLGLIILGRLVQLQIVEHDTYSPLSRKNSLRQEIVNPARGLIYDRKGRLMVDNEPIYSITITPANYDNENTPKLAEIIGVPVEEVEKRVKEAREYSWYRSSRLFTEVDFKTFSLIQENIWRLPGIEHQIESKRHYPIDSLKASHVLGYLREVSEKEYLEKDSYNLGDKIGKSGLELVYEDRLRGEIGIEYIKINAMGQSMGSYQNGSIDESPEKGSDLITTIDADLQIMAEDLMEGKSGAVVALDPNDGAVLSLVSAPQYEPRKLSGRIDSTYWQSINTDSTKPLYNRAISSRQPPGSTFKPLMALMGMEMGLINANTEINNPGYYYRGRRYNDLADPGKYDVGKALEQSSNTFFFWLMDNMVTKRSINRWNDLASDFGLGKTNNIDLPYESAGILPDSTYLNRVLGEGKWGIGDMLSLGVGQGFMSVSPLQMALVAAEIANGGYSLQPHIVQSIRESDGTVRFTQTEKKKIEWVDPYELSIVKDGMRRVVTDGSSRWYAKLDSIAIAGKTGTAQNPHGRDHGWFIGFAPLDNPQIAVAVLVENAGYGSISAVPIASLLIEKYISGKIKRNYVYDYVKNFEPRDSNSSDDEETTEQDSTVTTTTETTTDIDTPNE
ncbi:penicillin-binding protein 2 [Balneolaceae bacterium YR4-1]|uniref:Penicillin-binding protein 2 n=1 Tax=Halalkalibaculum roseum TaxID=2709311 RepID=A0A6M1SW94_9BACT|nr:penicillin-binding protein 2 [Halalkalibaculum roseum]NGP77212.1 penicillin-binding protein 2 [Halalkalibaculum roseum]